MDVAALFILAALVAFAADRILRALDKLVCLITQLNLTAGGIMAGEKELAERIKALEASFLTVAERIGTVATEAAADIAKIHDLLDANTGTGADVAGANAALDSIETKLTAIGSIIDTLKEQVDRPEGEVPPPPPVEG